MVPQVQTASRRHRILIKGQFQKRNKLMQCNFYAAEGL